MTKGFSNERAIFDASQNGCPMDIQVSEPERMGCLSIFFTNLSNTIMIWLLSLSLILVDTLPNEQALYQSLDSFYYQQTKAELSEFDLTTKNQWLKYLPTLGLNYTLEGQPHPTVSWSSNLIYTSQKDKERKQAKRTSIQQKNDLKKQTDQLRLKTLLKEYHFREEELHSLEQSFEIDSILFEIKKDQEKNIQISPVELLQAQQQFLKRKQSLQQTYFNLKKLKFQILELARFKE